MSTPLENGDAVTAADVVCNFSSEALVVHKEKIQFPDVANQELLETVGEEVASLSKDTGKGFGFASS